MNIPGKMLTIEEWMWAKHQDGTLIQMGTNNFIQVTKRYAEYVKNYIIDYASFTTRFMSCEISEVLQNLKQNPDMSIQQIRAPFTPDQVEQLNRYQNFGFVHEFTCANNHEGNRVLIASAEGWKCPSCDYTQNWAHAFMADKEELDFMESGYIMLLKTAKGEI